MTTIEIARTLALSEDVRKYEVKELHTDSRSIVNPQTTMFVAVKTQTGDGGTYIDAVYRQGCRVFLCSRLPGNVNTMPDAVFFIVPDTVAALQKVGAAHKHFATEIIAITGSRGKTTLKEWIFHLMAPLAEVMRSPRSYNSQIGVPLSLWMITPKTEIAVIEAGISRKGEMRTLAECISPDIVIFTSLGDEHADGFSSLEEKAREKALLATASGVKTVIFDADSEPLARIIREVSSDAKLIGWSQKDENAPLYIIPEVEATGTGEKRFLSFRWLTPKGKRLEGKVEIPDSRKADISNAANSLAYMLNRGVDIKVIADRFRTLPDIRTRLDVVEGVNECTLIWDSYTSDIASLRILLDMVDRRPSVSGSKVLVLADLAHEAGDDDIYSAIVRIAIKHSINRLITVGPHLKSHRYIFEKDGFFKEVWCFRDVSEMMSTLSTSDFYDETVIFKESPGYDLRPLREMLEARTHETVLEVNLDSIIRNYNYFRSHLPVTTGMIAMVKASGYGAGSYEIAKTMQDCGAAYVAVAVLDEGIDLRRAGITMPIMVMNPQVLNYRKMFSWNLEPEVYSFCMLRDIEREAEKCGINDYPVHIKLDTGMHRMGFSEKELPEVMDYLDSVSGVKIKSVFSHLATADCPDMDDYTELQLGTFKRMSNYIISRCTYPVLRHILNSAGILRFPEYHYDMVRLGIGLYGVNTLSSEYEKPLAVVSTLRTVIIAIRDREPGDTIGYGRKGVIRRKSRIATIPIGYADGMKRSFGCGRVEVYVNGMMVPTIGNICMDACMIDVTDVECKEGDRVEIFGVNAPIDRLAEADETIPYEILTSVSPRVKRVYYRE